MGFSKPDDTTSRLLNKSRMIKFAFVGGSGFIVNQGLLMLLHGKLDFALLWSSIIAIELSIVNNFIWNSYWTWHYDFQKSFRVWLLLLLKYHGTTVFTAFLGNVLILMFLVKFIGMDYKLANIIGIMAGSLTNYFLSEIWVFRKMS